MIDWRVLRPMRWATMGTVIAAREALQHGFAVNLSGGHHHAKPDAEEGFCIYSDITLAISWLRQDGLLDETERVVYVDLDAHQGNGVCHVFRHDARIFIFDTYNAGIYPSYDLAAQNRIDCKVALRSTCTEQEYLPEFLDSVTKTRDVGLAIYNAGTHADSRSQGAGHIVKELHDNSESLQAIAEELNQQGHTTQRGKPWNRM